MERKEKEENGGGGLHLILNRKRGEGNEEKRNGWNTP